MQTKTAIDTQPLFFSVFFVLLALVTPVCAGNAAGVGTAWQQRCAGIRTSFNPHTDLRSDALTLEANDPRWPTFLSWVQAQQIATFSLVGLRTSSAKQAAKGVVFRWAAGTPWEREVISPFGQALAHLLAERDWRDLDFADFFVLLNAARARPLKWSNG